MLNRLSGKSSCLSLR